MTKSTTVRKEWKLKSADCKDSNEVDDEKKSLFLWEFSRKVLWMGFFFFSYHDWILLQASCSLFGSGRKTNRGNWDEADRFLAEEEKVSKLMRSRIANWEVWKLKRRWKGEKDFTNSESHWVDSIRRLGQVLTVYRLRKRKLGYFGMRHYGQKKLYKKV